MSLDDLIWFNPNFKGLYGGADRVRPTSDLASYRTFRATTATTTDPLIAINALQSAGYATEDMVQLVNSGPEAVFILQKEDDYKLVARVAGRLDTRKERPWTIYEEVRL